MNLFWAVLFPSFFLSACSLGFIWATRLHFFSRAARDLNQIDIPNEVSEVRINELEMLVCDEADFYFKYGWKLTHRERRQAVSRRLSEARRWLHLVISNAALFEEVARFRIEAAERTATIPEEQVAYQLMDRASVVHFMAAACLARLALVDFCRILWPIYVPLLADRFQVRGNDLIVWYRHLAKEMLELAKQHYDDITYTRFIFQLTGLFTVDEAARLNRL